MNVHLPMHVGMVIGSREATALDFWVAVEPGQFLRLDDLVYVQFAHPDPEVGQVTYYGMVDQVTKLYEGNPFDTDVFLAQRDLLPVSISYAAHVRVTRLEPEEYLPPDPGTRVYSVRGQPEALEKALYYDRMKRFVGSREVDSRLPAGLLKNGEVAYLNLDFLDGSKGGHVNISGISGVATKTTYATFLLYSLLNSSANLEAGSTRALLFNVKGQDLFYLDQRNRQLKPEHEKQYRQLGLPHAPFGSVTFLAPPRKSAGDLLPDTQRTSSQNPAVAYFWDLVQFCQKGLLPFMFTDRGQISNLGFSIELVTSRLRQLANDQPGPHLSVDDWIDPDEDASDIPTFDTMGRQRIVSLHQLVLYIEYKLLPDRTNESSGRGKGPGAWAGRQAPATLEAFCRRLRAAAHHLGHLIRGDRPGQPPNPLRGSHQVSVIDIHSLHSQAQMFVVGTLLNDLFEAKEGGQYQGKIYVVLDELNKYAPREGDSPIRDRLLDIAERGRSLGVLLIGAQQTASEVERRIVANAAIRVVGRLDAAEAERPEYRYLPSAFRDRSIILPQGTMLLQQPELPVPLAVVFPYPAWATRGDEVERDTSDKTLRDLLF